MTAKTAKRFWLLPAWSRTASRPMDAHTLYALAALLLLVQLPHLPHLPVWVSLWGATLVVSRLILLRHPQHRFLQALLSPVVVTLAAASSAVLIRADYGYFVGRDPSVAFLFILVAAKFAEVRRATDATLLLCLAAFLLLTQYFYSQSIAAAVISLPAVIALAYALAVLRDPSNSASIIAQLKMVSKLLVQGLPLAALLFIVFPRLPGPLWSLPEDSMATTGLSDSMSPGSIGQLSQSDAVAFRVEFDGEVPPPDQRYWRGPVLTRFDGRRWQASNRRSEATFRINRQLTSTTDYTVMLQPHRQRWLFALEAAASLPMSYDATQTGDSFHPTRALGRLMADGQLIADKPVSQVLRYRQQSVLTDAMHMGRYPSDDTLFLPGKNTRTIEFANSMRSTKTSDSDYARSVLMHFNLEPFHYTLQPQLLGDAPVDEFLFSSRAGFCEHYAAAFVVLMRAAGIPARVVTGYLGGEMNTHYMIVRQSDAHAWAEAFIDGAWRRYDPTGAVAPSRVEQGLSAALPGESAVPQMARYDMGWVRDLQLQWDAINHRWQTLVVDFDNDSQSRLWQKLGLGKPALWQATAIALLATGLWCLALLGFPLSGRGSASPVERSWRRLCKLLNRHGLPRHNSESALEYLSRATRRWPRQAHRLRALSERFTSLRFQSCTINQTRQSLRWANRQIIILGWHLLIDAALPKKQADSNVLPAKALD